MIKKEFANKDAAVAVLNKYYINEYGWPSTNIDSDMAQFKYESERIAGVRLDLKRELDKFGRYGFAVQSVEIVEPKRWSLFVLKWT